MTKEEFWQAAYLAALTSPHLQKVVRDDSDYTLKHDLSGPREHANRAVQHFQEYLAENKETPTEPLVVDVDNSEVEEASIEPHPLRMHISLDGGETFIHLIELNIETVDDHWPALWAAMDLAGMTELVKCPLDTPAQRFKFLCHYLQMTTKPLVVNDTRSKTEKEA